MVNLGLELMADLAAFLATEEIRTIVNVVEKAIVLIDKYHYVSGRVRSVLKVSKERLKRGRRAKRLGRPVGHVGRPRSLNDEEELELVRKIKAAMSCGNPITLGLVLEQVRTLCQM